MRNHLNSDEKQNYILIDIAFDPTLDDEKPIDCFFAPDVSLAFNCKIKKSRRRKRELLTKRARQCHYCGNYFVKSFEKKQKHISCSAGQAGFTFSFDNGKIIDYQDHYSSLGDVPFSVYYDFETTTGSAAFFDAKMYLKSYCMVVAFHPEASEACYIYKL